jgi:hypothetical protein
VTASTADRAIDASERRISVGCELCQQNQLVGDLARKWSRGRIHLSDKLSAIRLPYFIKWLGEISSRLIGISSAVDAGGDASLL